MSVNQPSCQSCGLPYWRYALDDSLLCYASCSPEEKNPRRFKERQVLYHTMQWYPGLKIIGDRTLVGRSIDCDPTRYRIDVQLYFPRRGFDLHLEVDENEHSTYKPTCEVKRMHDLFLQNEALPVVFVRFNCDAAKSKQGKKLPELSVGELDGLRTTLDQILDRTPEAQITIYYLGYTKARERVMLDEIQRPLGITAGATVEVYTEV
jgi:hypothetical protein